MLPARTLTFQFDPVVAVPGQAPEEWEIVLQPLSSPLDGTIPDATLVGNRRKQTFVVSSTQTVEVPFQVVPSNAPGLDTTVFYRVGWRPRFFGKLTTFDFTMPDQDITFDDLQDLGAIVGSDVYLRQTDLGVHVAKLDSEGFVLDGNDVRVGIDNSAAIAAVNQERLDRQTADNLLRANVENQLVAQVAQTLDTATIRITNAVTILQNADTAEASTRSSAVSALNAAVAAVAADLNTEFTALSNALNGHTTTLGTKADLVDGKIPTNQLPTLSLTTAVPVANQSAMLALSSSQVQPGDLAVRPDGTWLLLATPASTLGNWIKLSAGNGVQSINGQTDIVVLAAADVGAIAIGAMIDQSNITGLVAALNAKASTTTVNGINTRLSTIENDATIVRTVSSLIAKALMPTDAVFVDGSNLLRKKNGDLIPGQGGSGGPIDWSQVVNAPATFPPTIGATSSTAVAGNDARLTNSRTPTAHAASHALAGSDPLTLTKPQITGLSTDLSGLGNRASTLESRVDALEAGGGGIGGGGASVKTLWFDGSGEVTGVTDFADFQSALILQKGPFGYDSDVSQYYYKPTGANDGEWRYPHITKNGHLELRKWDETAPPDPTPASATDLSTLSGVVATKADAADLSTLTGRVSTAETTIATKADSSALAAKADASTVTSLTTTVSGKADASALTTLAGRVTTAENTLTTKADSSTVAAKADASTVSALTTVVSGKADAAATTTALNLKADVSALAGKADATAVTSALALKADATAVTSALAGKADLVGGKLATSQIPALALHDTYVVANRAGMLALSTGQVQTGDIAIITATADKGTYIFTGSSPATFTDWTVMSVPADLVTSVNGQAGNVVLSASDVNARSAVSAIPLADVSGLTSALSAKVDTTTYTTGLAAKVGTTDVQTIVAQSADSLAVDVVSLANLSPSGTPSIDGVLTTVGMRVLLTAQTSSINNGIYVVSSGTWARASDMNGPNPSGSGPAGEYFVKGKQVVVSSGTVNANTFWQQSAAPGIVGTASNNWVRSLIAGPPLVYTAATNSGLTITGTAVVVKPASGIAVTTAGVGVDRNLIPGKYATDVPAGSTTVTITHNLGTQDITSVVLMDKTSKVMNLIGWSADTINTITIEFATAPTTGQWRIIVSG